MYMPVEYGEALGHKALGMGIRVGDYTAFVTKDAATSYPVSVETPRGLVIVGANEAGMYVETAPAEADIMQSLYFAWSAFHPETEIVAANDVAGGSRGKGPVAIVEHGHAKRRPHNVPIGLRRASRSCGLRHCGRYGRIARCPGFAA